MRISGVIFIFFFLSCKQKVSEVVQQNHAIYQSDFKTNIVDAKGFEVLENDSLWILKIVSLSDKYPFFDSLILPKKQLFLKGKYWKKDWNRIACQSTTHLAFLNALNLIDKVVAVSDIGYMPKDQLYDKIMAQKVVELNQNNTIDLEHIVSIQPDLFLMYPFDRERDKYKKANIQTLLVSEYLEQTPIARLEWIKFFGILTGESDKADLIYSQTKNRYSNLVKKNALNKTVFFNLPFKDTWDMPAANSVTVNLVKDAGFKYLYEPKNEAVDNISFLKEMVWGTAQFADYWIIIANRPLSYKLEDLLQEEPVYSTFTSVKNNHVIFCNTGQSSYFTTGILEPDIMLKDLLFLTGQIENHQPKYFQILK